MKEPVFLGLDEVIEIHNDQIKRYGGHAGIRDIGLLKSAIAMPAACFSGDYLHTDIYEMAAAYLLQIARNHPFMDGNKRTGLLAALVFLDINGVEVDAPKGSLYDLTMAVATGQAGKKEVAEFFRRLAR